MCRACPTLSPEQRAVRHAPTSPQRGGTAVNSDFIVWFDQYDDGVHRGAVGGKNASLGTLIEAGLPVPPGFSVTTAAFETMRRRDGVVPEVNRMRGEIDFDDPAAMQEISGRIRAYIEALPLHDKVVTAVSRAYEQLCERCGVDDVPVAVRSSATAEDLPDASFAGQHDTFLWVSGADAVVEHMARCWSSLFTDRAIAYRHGTGHDHEALAMSVGVQKMVQPKSAGVAFSLNPSDGDRSQVAIDASWGFGEAVVSGEVTPDNFLVDKVIYEVVSRTISPKTIEYRLNGSGFVEKADVDDDRAGAPCLDDDEIKAIAEMAKRAERHYGSPQDIEWAIDVHLPPGGNVVLLQSRPETVWSQKARRTVAKQGQGMMDGIVSTLISPVHTRGKASTVDDE